MTGEETKGQTEEGRGNARYGQGAGPRGGNSIQNPKSKIQNPHRAGHPGRSGILLFCPHRSVESVLEIDPEELKARGIRGVILDLDNTLVRWRQEEMTSEVTRWLTQLQAAGLTLCILSNSILSKRSTRIAERLGALNVSRARKPSRQGFHRALAALGTDPASTAIVGDQMFTDILGGNRAGIYTIMVQPIHHREFLYTRYLHRPPERLLLRLFRRQGHL